MAIGKGKENILGLTIVIMRVSGSLIRWTVRGSMPIHRSSWRGFSRTITFCDRLADGLIIYDDQFNLRSRRSRVRHYRRVSCCSSRLYWIKGTGIVEEDREPHNSEAISIERSNDISIHNPFFESSIHVVEVEVLIGTWSWMDNATLLYLRITLS